MVEISARKIKERDLLEVLRFAFYADQEALKEAFAKQGIEVVDETDLILLADYSKRGADLSGEIKKADGTPIKFSVYNTLFGYDINLNKLDQSGIKMVA